MHTSTKAHMHTCTHAHTHTRTHAHTHTRTHAHTHTHQRTSLSDDVGYVGVGGGGSATKRLQEELKVLSPNSTSSACVASLGTRAPRGLPRTPPPSSPWDVQPGVVQAATVLQERRGRSARKGMGAWVGDVTHRPTQRDLAPVRRAKPAWVGEERTQQPVSKAT